MKINIILIAIFLISVTWIMDTGEVDVQSSDSFIEEVQAAEQATLDKAEEEDNAKFSKYIDEMVDNFFAYHECAEKCLDVDHDPFDKEYALPTPCPFLRNNRCSIHPTRPNICVAYSDKCLDKINIK